MDTIKTLPGVPNPLGTTPSKEGVNFALFSEHATEVTLGLFDPDLTTPYQEFKLQKTDSVWHLFIENLSPNTLYGYKIAGPGKHFDPTQWTLDPYARQLNTSSTWGSEKSFLLSKITPASSFDWGNDAPLHLPFETLVIYEMHVRGFTKDPSSKVKSSGTYLGMIEKIPHLKKLGVNAVELLPIFEFDETIHPDNKLYNYWGYSTLNFFSPMTRYGSQPIEDFKQLVKALHLAGIEVILDVVFNHTADKGTFQRIDNAVYYLLDPEGNHTNYTGCGNTLNCNHRTVIDFILSSLRYWVSEMHVDGFRFDLASIFCRGNKGEVLEYPPLIGAINADPILKHAKLIAEPWDCAGLYQVGSFPGNWAEWNGKFRDTVRRFLKGTDGQAGTFASVMSGSHDLYGNHKAPHHSINFVTAHDGFSLCDLVSYNEKHNEANKENNADGTNSNDSWNCGAEGPTDDPQINALRERQIRNFYLSLCLSIGTPMLLMGDEYGHTREGNNNTYCQDNEKNYFLWDQLEQNKNLYDFVKRMLQIRKETPALQRMTFPTDQDITWHGHHPHAPDWSHESRFVAYTIGDLYIAFNAHFEPANTILPPLGENKKWRRLVDTSLLSPDEDPQVLEGDYRLSSYSALVLKQS